MIDDDLAARVALLRQYLEMHSRELFKALCAYVAKLNASDGDTVANAAEEVLSEICVRLDRIAANFDPARDPLPWLKRAGLNIIRQRLDRASSRHKYLALAADMTHETATHREAESEEDVLSRLEQVRRAYYNPCEKAALRRMERDLLLSHFQEKDRAFIGAYLDADLDIRLTADRWGMTHGAARTRLSRALTVARANMTRNGISEGWDGS